MNKEHNYIVVDDISEKMSVDLPKFKDFITLSNWKLSDKYDTITMALGKQVIYYNFPSNPEYPSNHLIYFFWNKKLVSCYNNKIKLIDVAPAFKGNLKLMIKKWHLDEKYLFYYPYLKGKTIYYILKLNLKINVIVRNLRG